jgi:hypothetical protein
VIDLVSAAIIHCSVTNNSKLITSQELTKIVKICNDYAKIVQNEWRKPGGTIKVNLTDKFSKKYKSFTKDDWIGFHATGRVVEINVKRWYALGNKDVIYPLTHEIAEAIVMPNPSPDGTGEVADPVGMDYFILNGYKVSQFITPKGVEYK